MILKVWVKKIFGTPKIYPDCEDSKKLCALMKQKCFTVEDTGKLKGMGYQIKARAAVMELTALARHIEGNGNQ